MAALIKIKSSTVADKVPASLAPAELAVNLADQKLYSADADGNVFELGATGGAIPSPTPPAGPSEGDLWFDSDKDTLNFWDGTQWIELSQAADSGVISVNTQVGVVVLDADDVGAVATTGKASQNIEGALSVEGNVGIGIVGPPQKLSIKIEDQYDGIEVSDKNGKNVAQLLGFKADGASGGFTLWEGDDKEVQILANGPSFINGGNLGIGTNNPLSALHVRQSALTDPPSRNAALYLENNSNCEIQLVGNSANNCQVRFGTSNDSFKGALQYDLADNSLDFYTNGVKRVTVVEDGNVLIGGTLPAAPSIELKSNGTVIASNYYIGPVAGSFGLEGDTRIEMHGTESQELMLFKVGDSNKMLINSDGNVGIGTSDPQSPLDVSGDIQATNYATNRGQYFRITPVGGASYLTAANNGSYATTIFRAFNGTEVKETMRIVGDTGNVNIGGVPASAPNIELKNDGSITSTSFISAGNNLARLEADGRGNFKNTVSSNLASGNAWESYESGTLTCNIAANGSANFAGTIKAASYNLEALLPLPA